MRGESAAKRFAVVLFWLAKRMSAPGGLPKKIDAELQEDYRQALYDIRIERIEWASRHLFATKTWFPMPHEIREAAMAAPSTVLAALNLNQKALPAYTTHEDGAEKLQSIIDSLSGAMSCE